VSSSRIRLTEAARSDLRDLEQQDPRLLVEALRVIQRVGRGDVEPKPLRPFGKTGDLSDCSRVYFGAPPDEDTHRVIFRTVADQVEILEVVVVEERRGDLAYLLAALRLERLHDPVRRSDAQRAVFRLRAQRPDRPR
jgi:hypothetical protein